MLHLGLDIGGTFIKYALVDDEMQVVKKWKKPTIKFETKDAFYDYLCSDIDCLDEIDYVGVSAPGVISEDSTVLSKAAINVRIMQYTNVNEEIGKRLNKPCATINDAKAAGFCEMQMGNGKNSKSSVYYVIGTGIGGCVCDESRVIQGVDGIAGEFSCLPIIRPNGTMGQLSDIASMTALVDIYNRDLENEAKLQYGKDICNLYLKEDKHAIEAMDEWCNNILMGMYLIITFYNPEVICLGGGISEEDWFINKIKSMFDQSQWGLRSLTTTRIDRCKYSNDANILGAILFAKQQTKQ